MKLAAVVVLAAAAGCERAPVAVEPGDAAARGAGGGSIDAGGERAAVDAGEAGPDAAGEETLLQAFREALLRELPAGRAAPLRALDLSSPPPVPNAERRLAYFALDRAARLALPAALEPVMARRAARVRALRPLGSVRALEVLREVLYGAAGQAGRLGAVRECDGSTCDDAAAVSCAAAATDAVYQALEDLESAEEDAMEPQRWAPDGAPFRFAPAGAAGVGRGGESPPGGPEPDPDLYRVAMRAAARAVAASWACAPPGDGADAEVLLALAVFARGEPPPRPGDAGR